MLFRSLKEVFQSKDLERLEQLLREQKENLEMQARRLEMERQDTQWLVDFLEYSRSMVVDNHLYVKEQGEMTVLRVPCDGDDAMYTMDMELRRVAASPPFRNCQTLNPYGYLLDFDHLLRNRLYPQASTVCIRGESLKPSPYLFTVPGGRYLCCKAKIFSDGWDVSPLARYCQSQMCIRDRYCRHCFRKRLVGLADSEIAKQFDRIIDYIKAHPEINNCLLYTSHL